MLSIPSIRQGLNNPAFEHDACGVGLVGLVNGRRIERGKAWDGQVAAVPEPAAAVA